MSLNFCSVGVVLFWDEALVGSAVLELTWNLAPLGSPGACFDGRATLAPVGASDVDTDKVLVSVAPLGYILSLFTGLLAPLGTP